MKIIDCFTYNGESDLLDIHLNTLKDFVDQFIIVEAKTTFSGKPKSLHLKTVLRKYKDLPIKYWINDENYSEEDYKLARSSPNTQFGQGAEHWLHEFMQKEAIKKALTHLKDDDLCFIGDVDEIWEPGIDYTEVAKLKLKVYTYWLNNRSSEEFWGTIVAPYNEIRYNCLNHLRSEAPKTTDYFGWHFTSMGGEKRLKRKLTDSYTKETYANDLVMNNLASNLSANQDFLGRDFKFWLDESDWPNYLKVHREEYKSLIK